MASRTLTSHFRFRLPGFLARRRRAWRVSVVLPFPGGASEVAARSLMVAIHWLLTRRRLLRFPQTSFGGAAAAVVSGDVSISSSPYLYGIGMRNGGMSPTRCRVWPRPCPAGGMQACARVCAPAWCSIVPSTCYIVWRQQPFVGQRGLHYTLYLELVTSVTVFLQKVRLWHLGPCGRTRRLRRSRD